MGYSFHWTAGCRPYFVTPDGNNVLLLVDQDILFLDEQNTICQPTQPGQEYSALGPQGTYSSVPATADQGSASAGEGNPKSHRQDLELDQ